ncbi:MAG: hypothetical protein ACYTHJ_20825 [Planctomycetota bacterium]|jgi:hypothetical protein
MTEKKVDKKLAGELLSMLADKFEGIEIDVSISDRWKRPCVTFSWNGFEGLLPEERFQRLAQFIPESFRGERMAGVIWLELVSGESIEDFLKHPRSEDIEQREREIYYKMREGGLFDLLAKELGGSPERNCEGGFAKTLAAIKRSKGLTVTAEEAKLVFIRHGVYCDCQVLQGAQPALAQLYAGAA